jgi:hypothetical protein
MSNPVRRCAGCRLKMQLRAIAGRIDGVHTLLRPDVA